MTKFPRIAVYYIVCLSMAGCHGDLRGVWTENSGRIPITTPAIEGFTITPHQAQEIAEREFGMRKTVQHLYADKRYYYIVDGFLGSSHSKAARAGVRVDGKTGKSVRFQRSKTSA